MLLGKNSFPCKFFHFELQIRLEFSNLVRCAESVPLRSIGHIKSAPLKLSRSSKIFYRLTGKRQKYFFTFRPQTDSVQSRLPRGVKNPFLIVKYCHFWLKKNSFVNVPWNVGRLDWAASETQMQQSQRWFFVMGNQPNLPAVANMGNGTGRSRSFERERLN